MAGAVVVVALGVVGYLVWPDDSDDDSSTSGGAASYSLPRTDIVTTQVNGGPQQVVAIHSDGATTDLLDEPDAALPALNDARDKMVVIRSADGGGYEPWLVDRLASSSPVATQLFSEAARSTCPAAGRAAWDPSGDRLAIVCRDLDARSIGLWIMDLDGTGNLPTKPRLDWGSLVGAPTWDGDQKVYFVSTEHNGTSTLHAVTPTGRTAPVEIDTGPTAAWLSHPDWCTQGLLYQRSAEPDTFGTIELIRNGSVVPLKTDMQVDSPTWAPDCDAIAWLAASSEDPSRTTIWTAPVDVSSGVPTLGTASESSVQGEVGAPAWGSR